MMYKKATLGGTFDRLHKGHKTLLTTAFENAKEVIIGLSTPSLFQEKVFAHTIESYDLRENHLKEFLNDHGVAKRATIIPLKSVYGSTLDDHTLEAIIVSDETRANAEHINRKRQEKNLPPLEIISIPLVSGEDNVAISSERIRKGEIDSKGLSYLKFIQNNNLYTLPQSLRGELQKPFGNILSENDLPAMKNGTPFITSVGDITTLTLFKAAIPPAIAIIDGRTQRHELEINDLTDFFSLPQSSLFNTAGTITSEAAAVYQQALSNYLSDQKTQIIRVEGEEDLIALPAILLAPLSSLVIYGQHDIGMVSVEVTPEKKEYAKKLLSQFDR